MDHRPTKSSYTGPDVIYVHEKARDSFLFEQMTKAHPDADIVSIKYNTAVFKDNYGLVDLRPRSRFREKRKKAAMLFRQAKWRPDPNGRSTDFLPVSMMTQGCGFGCSYCYTERRHPNNFPKLYNDARGIVGMVLDVVHREPQRWREKYQSLCRKDYECFRDPAHNPMITFDLGCDSDCVLDNQLTANEDYPGHIVDVMNQIGEIPGAMCSFATKSAFVEPFIQHCTTPGKNRIRLSLMPEHHRAVLECGTSKVAERLQAVNDLVDAGFEVHINLSPIVVTDDFEAEYSSLLQLINNTLTPAAKAQMAYEIIFLTHSEKVFDHIECGTPKAHDMMVNGPLALVPKPNKKNVLSYSRKDKKALKQIMHRLIDEHTPYSRIRYMF